MKNTILTIYAVFCFLVTGVALMAFLLFFENQQQWLSTTVSLPINSNITLEAIFVDFGLLVLFGVQHSIMARNWFKKWWTHFIPRRVERATYLLISSLCLTLIVYFWQPFGTAIWDYRASTIGSIFYAISLFGLVIILISAFSISASEFMGVKQLRSKTEQSTKQFVQPLFYEIVRHPIYFGFLLAFWSTPLLTPSHVLFTIVMTTYIVIGASFEEQNLIDEFGLAYMDYQRTTPMLIPFTKFNWWSRY